MSKKVGIMSMQRVVNYGSFLQAYSLKKNLEKLGAEVQFVDYKPGEVLVTNSGSNSDNKKSIFQKISEHCMFPRKNSKEYMNRCWAEHRKFDSNYDEYIKKYLGIRKEENYKPELDLVVIGSDEVFNCLQPNPAVGFSHDLFGEDSNSKYLISYAGSFGNTNEEGLRKYGIYEKVSEMINKFDLISARDKNSCDILGKMYKGQVSKNVDPVFLYDYEEETKIDVTDEHYLVVYAYAKRISRSESAEIIRFAKKHGLKIVCLCAPQEFLPGYKNLNPFEVLAWIRQADYVVTDTFHGTVFSIKFNRRFATFIRKGREGSYGNSDKLNDLLNVFGLGKRSVNDLSELKTILDTPIDYAPVNQKIREEREKSAQYLKQALMLGE